MRLVDCCCWMEKERREQQNNPGVKRSDAPSPTQLTHLLPNWSVCLGTHKHTTGSGLRPDYVICSHRCAYMYLIPQLTTRVRCRLSNLTAITCIYTCMSNSNATPWLFSPPWFPPDLNAKKSVLVVALFRSHKIFYAFRMYSGRVIKSPDHFGILSNHIHTYCSNKFLTSENFLIYFFPNLP